MVLIRWSDSSGHDTQVDAGDLPDPVVIESVGWLAKRTKKYVVVCRDHHPSPNSYEWRASMAIPRHAILRIDRLHR